MHHRRSGVGLFGFYAIVTLIPIVVLGGLLARGFRSDLDRQGLRQGVAIANAVARSAVDPILTGDTLVDGPTASERGQLVAAADPLLRSGEALKLRVRDAQGHVAFDPTHPNRPPYGPTDDEVVEAIDEGPVRLLTRMNADEVDRASAIGARVIEVYTPIHGTRGGPAIGALEIYVPYQPIAATIDASYRRTIWLMTIGLFALWMLLAGVSWITTRRLRRSAREYYDLARRDNLTGIANRTAFADDLRTRLATCDDDGLAVITLDIDGLTQINEVLGPENGDRFLIHVAARVQEAVSTGDIVGRIGGDEFGIIAHSAEPRVTDRLIADVRRALLEEIEVGGVELAAEIAVGRVVAHRNDTASEALRRSGVACRAAEAANTEIVDYDPSLEHFDTDRLALVAELRRTIGSDQLVLHYQPKIASHDGEVVGVEALIRWQHPTRGLLPPGAFLPAVESTELIVALTDWVIDEAARQATAWEAAGIRVPIAVNVSARCLRDPAFADRLIGALIRRKVSDELISIEITETAVIADPRRAAATLRRLADRGIKISVDDFGVGFTSISHLETLPIKELKIDRQFVASMTSAGTGTAMVRGIISLGHELGMSVVAEGVEDQATLDLLAEVGCDIAQGYLIARPAPAADFEAWFHTRRAGAATPESISSPA